MQKLLLALALSAAISGSAQTVFWTENFNNGCNAGCQANAYVGPNGAWTQTVTGAEGSDPNLWYVSCAENGHTPTICGTGCVPASPTATLASLHVGSNPNSLGDVGAAYDAGGLCGFWVCPQTNRRIESPVINCTGQSNITIAFNYIETGAPPSDDASLWYNDGSGWNLLVNTAQTNNSGCGGQGRWTAFSMLLPASCNNNANVRIGFRWVNNDDGVGTDPSFAVDDITLSVPSSGTPPTAAITASTTSICVGQSVNFTDNSTGAPTSWNWTFPSGSPGSSTSQNPGAVTWNTAGTFTVTLTATNANGSTNATQVITVNALPTVTASASSPTICAGQSTNLTGSGASTYTWNPGSLSGSPVSVSPGSTTTYTVTGTSGAGCTNTAQVTVTVNPLPTVTASASSPTICAGQSTNLTGSGASTYTWNPGSLSGSPVSVSPASTTTYTVTGTSGAGCTNTAQVTVTVNPLPTVTSSAAPNVICSGQTTTLTGGGASTYTWNPGSLSGSPVNDTPGSTTTYTVTGTDANGCTNTSQVTVTVQICAPPTASFTMSSNTICAGDSISFTDNSTGGPTSWTWTFPGGTPATSNVQNPGFVTWTTAGTYTVSLTVNNPNGSDNTTQVITVNPAPTVTATPSSSVICSGQSVTLTAGGASTYTWNPGSLSGSPVNDTPASTTTYTLTGTDSNGCTDTAQVTVTVQSCSPPTAVINPPTSVCEGYPVNFGDNSTGGPTSWNWTFPGATPPTSTAQNPTNVLWSTAGSYTVTLIVSNANGSDTDQVVYIVNPLPVVVITASDDTICSASSVTLTGSGAAGYVWNPGGQTINPLVVSPTSTTTYTLVGIASSGCMDSTNITIVVNPAPNVTATALNGTICVGQSTTLTSGGASSYVWQPGGQTGVSVTVSPTATTTYTVTGTDANGCTATATVSVIVQNCNVPTAAFTVSDSTICPGTCIDFTDQSVGATSWTWYFTGGTPNSSTQQNPANICYSTPGMFTVFLIATNATGSDTTTMFVNVGSTLPVTTTGYTQIAIGNSVMIGASGNGTGTYSWSPPDGLSCTNCQFPIASPTVTTTYTVTMTDAFGCQSSDTMTVEVIEKYELFVPSAFSPNGDGTNEVLYVRGAGVRTVQFVVFSRIGEKVFETTDIRAGWDGDFRGMPMNTGVFSYYVKAEFYNGTSVEKKGDVTLVR